MSNRRIELCVNIPGPKLADQELEEIELFALNKFSTYILEEIQAGRIQRVIDYMGNYFLLYSNTIE